ncbi:TNF receptor-associated factor 4-like [Dysidea avara]|uniref:TNF receptor-associated factor 4-like n=1 Tax=Dysidea avara TaxID=196820 RepID=UPI00332BBBB5
MAVREVSAASEYEFLEPSSKDVSRCPVCFEIFKTPFLTACCGNHFCLSCVESTKENKDQCPLCQTSPINGIIDKNLQRRINELKIYCRYRKEGCQWTGEISELSKHLDLEADCKYVLVSCPYSCEEQVSRIMLQQHMDKICQLRPYSCKFCDYSSTYKDVTSEHYTKCSGNMVPCPNSCGEELIQFCNLERHLSICPCELVSCSFANVGCKERLKRQHLQLHIETSILEHQELMHDAFIKIKEQNERLKQVQKSADYWINGYRIMAEEVKRNNWRLYLSSLAVVSTSIPVPLSPVVLEITNYNSIATKTRGLQYFSVPFYTHSGGYKMQLGIYPNGTTARNSTHLSLSIYIMKGENDERLDWPFAGSVKIFVLNQSIDAEHFQKTCCTANPSIPGSSLAKPSTDKIRNDSGWELSTFISRTEIKMCTAHKQYIMNNTIFLRVITNVEDGSDLFL